MPDVSPQETVTIPEGTVIEGTANSEGVPPITTPLPPQPPIVQEEEQTPELSPTIPQEPVIEKIQCDRCQQVLNSKEEIPAHNLKEHNGRPCGFCQNREEIMKKVNSYLEECKNGKPPKIPYIEEIAVFVLNVDEDTIGSWANKKIADTDEPEHPEFLGAIKGCKTLQKLYLLKRTTGRFNPTGAIFQLKANHGFMESEKRILAGDKSSEPISIKIIEDIPKIINE